MKNKQLLNLGLLLLLVTGCKLSAFNQDAAPNANAAAPNNQREIAFQTENSSANAPINTAPTPKPAAKTQAANAVCHDPSKPCHHKDKHFDDWELSFKMPDKLQPNKTYSSAPFYAVILKTYEMGDDCDGGEFIEAVEADRKKEQANQLERKVFAAYQCPNMAAVGYEFDGRWSADKESIAIGNFLAIYAGESKQEGEEALRFLKSEYPNAVLKQMTATFEVIEQ